MNTKNNVVFADKINDLGSEAKEQMRWLNARLALITRSCTDISLEGTIIRTDLYHVRHFDAGSGADWHRHPFTELTWIQGGPIEYESRASAITLHDGEFFIMPAFVPHRWHVANKQTVLHGFMLTVLPVSDREKSLAPQLHMAAASLNHHDSLQPSAIDAFRQTETHAKQDDELSTEAGASYLRAGLAITLRHILASAPEKKSRPTDLATSALPATLERAVAFIMKNLSHPLDVPTIANHVRLSSRQMDRMFHMAFDMPTGAFLLHTRLERARYLLDNSDLNIKEIASTCGFTDSNYFGRIFRKRIGHSPGEYRRQH